MVRLYRDREYVQVWERGNLVVTHRGTIGQRGTVIEQLAAESTAEEVQRQVTRAMEQGFMPLQPDRLAKVLVHYRFRDWPPEDVGSFGDALRQILGDELGWTGNGMYDGYSVGNQELTLWFLTIDAERATTSILEVLGRHGYLEDPETEGHLAFDKGGGNIVFAHPPERSGQRFM